MKNIIIYNLCIVVSCLFEIYFAIYFYKAFHDIKDFFKLGIRKYLCYICFVLAKVIVNMQYNNKLNLLFSIVQYLAIVIVLFKGNLWLKIVHSGVVVFIGSASELLVYFLMKLPASIPTNQIFENDFAMVSAMFAAKLIYFMLISFTRQFSKYSSGKLDLKLFGNYILIPFAISGIMFVIPYVRINTKEYTIMDIILIVFFILALLGNINLFYMFIRYNKMKEEQMLHEVGKAKYEEKKKHYNKIKSLDEKYRELLHNINHYLRQIGIYAENNQTDKIKQVLADLEIEFIKGEKEIICANVFLNSILADFKERALKEQVCIELFVETGFKIEFIKETDLVVVLGNLLDNSLEAAKKCKKGKINASFFMQNQGLLSIIYIANTYNGLINKRNRNFVSTKSEQGVHGIGIKSVNNIIDRYNGYMQQEYSDSIFKTTVIIPLK